MTYIRHIVVLRFHLPLYFFLSVLCGSWDVATRSTKTQPLCPDCICKSKEKWVMRCRVNNRNTTVSLHTHALTIIHHKAASCNAYRQREAENIIWILLKWQSFLRQTDWWNTGWAHLAQPFNQNPSDCLHIHFLHIWMELHNIPAIKH